VRRLAVLKLRHHQPLQSALLYLLRPLPAPRSALLYLLHPLPAPRSALLYLPRLPALQSALLYPLHPLPAPVSSSLVSASPTATMEINTTMNLYTCLHHAQARFFKVKQIIQDHTQACSPKPTPAPITSRPTKAKSTKNTKRV
jgi:hypothetical protein